MTDTDVLIVGGGPVGLFLGCCLAQCGVAFRIIEKQPTPCGHSRSIGIHPPALELLARVGIADALLQKGVRVTTGAARTGNDLLGRISFAARPGPYGFILAIGQHNTEDILRRRLRQLAPDALVCGVAAESVHEDEDEVCVTLSTGSSLRARLLVGCDGMGSQVRQSAGFHFDGAAYPDRYAMGDFDDDTGLGDEACVFLSRQGVVESFPLPAGTRRWVVRDTGGGDLIDAAGLAQAVQFRTGFAVSQDSSTMFSAFRTFAFAARPFARRRIMLAGDAGHVVSPIGGQGMNLGWMDVADLVPEIEAVLTGHAPADVAAGRYGERRLRAWRIARRRAEFNMWMGREGRASWIKQQLTRVVLGSRLANAFATRFSMGDLASGDLRC